MDIVDKELNEIIHKILPGAIYEQCFKIEAQTFPFYSFCQADPQDRWSDQMTERLESPTRNHFIDLYNRRIVLDGLNKKLSEENGCYLDMGCSSGYMLEDVLGRFSKVKAVGADYFQAGLLQCHQRLPDVPLFQADLVHCQFPDNLFDAISCLNVLEHLEEDDRAIQQLYRIAKPGGVVAITVPTMPGLYDMHDEVYGHLRRYELHNLERKVVSAGFKILRSNYFGFLIYPAFYVVKRISKIRFDQLSPDEKKQRAFSAIRDSGRCHFLDWLCRIEQALGGKLDYPFGLRGYIIAEK